MQSRADFNQSRVPQGSAPAPSYAPGTISKPPQFSQPFRPQGMPDQSQRNQLSNRMQSPGYGNMQNRGMQQAPQQAPQNIQRPMGQQMGQKMGQQMDPNLMRRLIAEKMMRMQRGY